MKVKIDSTVVNGVLSRNRIPLANAVKQFNGKDITITLEKKRKARSNDQNAYYWGVVVSLIRLAIIEAWGEKKTSNEIHELLKTECNYQERINEETGEVLKESKSTTNNSTEEQEIFHDLCRRWAFDWFNIEIPLPNEQILIEI